MQWLYGLIFPIRCLGCTQFDHWLCVHCLAGIPRCPGALGAYQQPLLKRAIHLMKYSGYRGIATTLGRYLAARVDPTSYDLIVPVPLHWRKRWQRGFNQTEWLAKPFPKPYLPALRKTRHTVAQATLDRTARQANLVNAFQVRPIYRGDIQGQRILLIDDVYTTGATTNACASSLLAAGAASVQVVVIAVNQNDHDQ